MRTGYMIVPLICTIVILQGCGGTDSSTNAQKSTQSYSFTADIMPVLVEKCRPCHGHNGNYTVTTPEETYNLLLDVPPRASTGYDYFILPKDPTRSLLYLKAQNIVTHGGGERITPRSEEAKMFKEWIMDGAPYE